MKKKNLYIAIGYICAYLVLYLAGRIIWCDFGENSVTRWLFTATPTGKHSYLYGWLLSSYFYWYALAISALPSLMGKVRFSAATTVGFVVGVAAGVIFGPYPEGAEIGHDHYGWAIWGVIYLISIAVGVIVEKRKK